jgi:hypothetical protein
MACTNILGLLAPTRLLLTTGCFVLALCSVTPATAAPTVKADYAALAALTDRFFTWKRDGSDPLLRSAQQATQRLSELHTMQAQLKEIEASGWDRSQQADYLALRGALDQHDFLLQVSKPWERDPGFYVDRMQRLTFTDLPTTGAALDRLRKGLQSTVALADTAKNNLANVPADFAALAIHNLTQPDGVGHGHPYRTVPPQGVLGWYGDLLQRARQSQPELVEEIEVARDAVKNLHAWLLEHQASMTAEAGVGEELLDWYLMHVKFMPYTSDNIEALAERELDRTWAF